MSNISRRSFLAGFSTIPFSVWFQKYASAQAVLTRYNLMSANGQTMLKTYANAVKMMMNAPESSPTGWLFQWYTHAVRGDRTKAGEITRIYPTPSPQRDLAQQTWNTCQAHRPGDVEDYFLPWHRMYVYFLERIIRKVSGVPSFTLPYWSYTNRAITSGPRMPTPFISPAATTNPLYRRDRNALANGGQPIDRDDPGSLNLNSLRQCVYSQQGAVQGFNLNLDANLHGTVHVLVGNGRGMGSVPWAANDPIFWMHHCNIDRLWASWNRGGRTNPTTATWLNKQFVFADENGNRVVATVRDFRDIGLLRYTYDRFEPVPACPPPALAAAAAQTRGVVRSGAVELGRQPVTVNLTAPAGAAAGTDSIAARVRTLGKGRRLFLVLRNLRANVQPGVLYRLFLELPSSASARAANNHKLGVINFFDAVEHDSEHTGAGMSMTSPDKFFSFDITDVAKRLLARRLLTAEPRLTIVPADEPDAAARPVIGEVTLVEQ